MVDVWIIEGARNSGKSTLARALTGAPLRSNRGIRVFLPLTNQIEWFHVAVGGLQEANPPITPNDYIQLIQNAFSYCLVCLWMAAGPAQQNRNFTAQNYYNAFRAANWTVRDVASLGALAPGAIGGGYHHPNPMHNAPNEIAAQVRTAWNWV